MALLRFAPIVATVRGSIGGVTFTRTGPGPTARTHTHQTSAPSSRPPFDLIPNDASRSYRRANMATLVYRWATILTETQRAAWSTLATETRLINRLGEPYQPTGRTLYLRANLLSSMTPIGIKDTAPPRATVQMPRTEINWVAVSSWFTVQVFLPGLLPSAVLTIGISQARPLSRSTHSNPFFWTTPMLLPPIPVAIPNSAHKPGWEPNLAYFFRLRAVNIDAAISHPITIRAVSA